MRISILIILACLLQVANTYSQEREFTVKGKFLTSYYDGLTVYLNQIDYKGTNNLVKLDSVTVDKSTFIFTGKLDKSIAVRYITLMANDDLTAIVVLEPGTIELTMSDVPHMSGTPKNDELQLFTSSQIKSNGELEVILEKAQNLHKAGTLDEATSDILEAEFKGQQDMMQQSVYDFVSKNILNEIGEFFFTIYASNFGVTNLEKLYASATPEFQQAAVPKSLMHQNVWALGSLREGQKLQGLDMKKPDGTIEDIAVNFGKGKVVLVDFWASWCGPCIKTMPILVKLYDRYRDSGFEIVGISLDQDEKSWQAAIKRLGMEWPQYVDDGGGWTGGAAKEYNITRIPQTYLLDQEGKIVGHDLSGQALISKIEELLKGE